jgi:integrase
MNNLAVQNTNNVVGLFIDTPIAQINHFLQGYDSENSRTTYENHYRQMFMFICHKEMENIIWDDIQNITIEQVKMYRDNLKKQYKNNTINQKMFACKALWDELFENGRVNKNVFNLRKIKLKEKKNSHGSLTEKEMDLLLDFCLNHEKQKPVTKMLYFKFLYITGLRKNIAQSIMVDDIIRKVDIQKQEEVWVIDKEDKGKDREVSIRDTFYNELYKNYINEKETWGYKDNKLFHINDDTIDSVLERFCKYYNIDKITRNITQHSIKSASGDRVFNRTGDIKITAKHLGHDNIQTSYDHYLGKNDNYTEQPSYSLDNDYSYDMLEGLGDNTILKLIKNYTERCGNDIVDKLCMELERETSTKSKVHH